MTVGEDNKVHRGSPNKNFGNQPRDYRNVENRLEANPNRKTEEVGERSTDYELEPETNGCRERIEQPDIEADSIDQAIDEINSMLEEQEEELRVSKLADEKNWATSLENNYELEGSKPGDSRYVIFEPSQKSGSIPGFRLGKNPEYITGEKLEEILEEG